MGQTIILDGCTLNPRHTMLSKCSGRVPSTSCRRMELADSMAFRKDAASQVLAVRSNVAGARACPLETPRDPSRAQVTDIQDSSVDDVDEGFRSSKDPAVE